MSRERRVELGAWTLDVLLEIYLTGNLHGDLQPHNIWLLDGRPVVTDFETFGPRTPASRSSTPGTSPGTIPALGTGAWIRRSTRRTTGRSTTCSGSRSRTRSTLSGPRSWPRAPPRPWPAPSSRRSTASVPEPRSGHPAGGCPSRSICTTATGPSGTAHHVLDDQRGSADVQITARHHRPSSCAWAGRPASRHREHAPPEGGRFADVAYTRLPLPVSRPARWAPSASTRRIGSWRSRTTTAPPGAHPRLLDLLAARGETATFFALARQVRAHPEIARRIVADGHELALHGHDHRSLLTMGDAEAVRYVRDAKNEVESIVSTPIVSFRPRTGPTRSVRPTASRAWASTS
ncbi:polysaccharide deacetylase family protein [Oerskovia sp. M15]